MVVCRDNTYYDEAVKVCSPCDYICPEGTEEDCKRLCPGFGDRDRVGDRVGDDDPINLGQTSNDVPTSHSPDWLNPYVIMLIVIVVLLCIIGFMAFYIVLTRRKKKPRTPNASTVESEPLNGPTDNQLEMKISRSDRNSLTQDEGVGSMRSASYSSTSTNGTTNGNNRPHRQMSMCSSCSGNMSEDTSLPETKKTSQI